VKIVKSLWEDEHGNPVKVPIRTVLLGVGLVLVVIIAVLSVPILMLNNMSCEEEEPTNIHPIHQEYTREITKW